MHKSISALFLPVVILSFAPIAFAESRSECSAMSMELSTSRAELQSANQALMNDEEEIILLGEQLDDAVNLSSLSPENKKKADELRVEFETRQTAYNERYADLQVKGRAFNSKQAVFTTTCSRFFASK